MYQPIEDLFYLILLQTGDVIPMNAVQCVAVLISDWSNNKSILSTTLHVEVL